MRNRELVRQLQSPKSLISRTDVATWQNIELQGHWGKYLCVLTAGFLENAHREIYTEFVINAASPPVANFASATLENVQNPKSQRFVETAGAFNSKWADDLGRFLDGDAQARRNAIDSIMANRHLIAHGRNTSISVVRVKDYLDRCVEVIEFIEAQCLDRHLNNLENP